MSDKIYITAQQLLEDSYQLGIDIFNSGYKPDFIVGVWRGGTPIGIAIQELFAYLGHKTDHIAIRTSSYTGIGQRSKQIDVHGLGYILDRATSEHAILIVDDVHDTGLSVAKIVEELETRSHGQLQDIKVATPYYKPGNNRSNRKPDFYLSETEKWLVFPHELVGLDLEEALSNKIELKAIEPALRHIHKKNAN